MLDLKEISEHAINIDNNDFTRNNVFIKCIIKYYKLQNIYI
jgi:hypothetical protein